MDAFTRGKRAKAVEFNRSLFDKELVKIHKDFSDVREPAAAAS